MRETLHAVISPVATFYVAGEFMCVHAILHGVVASVHCPVATSVWTDEMERKKIQITK